MTMRVKELAAFITERYNIFYRREHGQPKPWTDDPILRAYRFCNVHRENDTVTRWIAEEWRTPNETKPDLWFALVLARLINNPPTLQALGYPHRWNADKFIKIMEFREREGCRNYNPAYIVSTNGMALPKHIYLAHQVLGPLWAQRTILRPASGQLLEMYHEVLMRQNGLGSFLAAQVVADLKYARPYVSAPDWGTFAAPGPGSKRGLNRVYERPLGEPWGGGWHTDLLRLKAAIDPLLRKAHVPAVHAQDLQNCLCEFDKYERVRLGEGRPKQRYNGG